MGRGDSRHPGQPPLGPILAPILAQAIALQGHFHQLSVHPGGTIIAPGPLWHHVPFQPAPAKEGVSITQCDKDGVEDYGLVKIDLLGFRSLSGVRDTLAVFGDRAPAALLWHPRLDPAIQDLLAKGDSIGGLLCGKPCNAAALSAGEVIFPRDSCLIGTLALCLAVLGGNCWEVKYPTHALKQREPTGLGGVGGDSFRPNNPTTPREPS